MHANGDVYEGEFAGNDMQGQVCVCVRARARVFVRVCKCVFVNV